jgi:hypothetical protein
MAMAAVPLVSSSSAILPLPMFELLLTHYQSSALGLSSPAEDLASYLCLEEHQHASRSGLGLDITFTYIHHHQFAIPSHLSTPPLCVSEIRC